MERNRGKQTVTYSDGTVHCDAFRNLGHGTHYRTTLKPHELTEVNRESVGVWSNAARRRRGKIMRRSHLLDPNVSNR